MENNTEKSFCPRCGTATPAGGGFCPKCGQPLNAAVAEPPQQPVNPTYVIVNAEEKKEDPQIAMVGYVCSLVAFMSCIVPTLANKNTLGWIWFIVWIIGLGISCFCVRRKNYSARPKDQRILGWVGAFVSLVCLLIAFKFDTLFPYLN